MEGGYIDADGEMLRFVDTHVPHSAEKPPTAWTTPEPAKSNAPQPKIACSRALEKSPLSVLGCMGRSVRRWGGERDGGRLEHISAQYNFKNFISV